MGTNGTHTHWGMVINNYDETDLALVQQGYPDHIRQLVYTLEQGAEGTPHIQAFIKMKRDCRLNHMKKLFPRGHFNYLDSSEYKLNAQRYAQKLDATAVGSATITNGDPLHTIEGTVRTIINRMINDYIDTEDLTVARRAAEYDAIMEDYSLAKIFVSATYRAMWKDYGHQMHQSIFATHTHTHTHTHAVGRPPLKEYVDVGIQTDAAEDYDEEGSEGEDGSFNDAASGVSESADEECSDEDCEGSDCS